ncbi:hypothetical protein BH23ACT9_BH23ACT9_23220 [soil metagenome]
MRLGDHGTGGHLYPMDAAWVLDGPVAELAALLGADTPEALHRVLVIPGRRTDTRCDDAVHTVRHAHAGRDDGLIESAVLLCTHHRWKGVARSMLEALVEGGILDEGHVGRLAAVFLDADDVCVTAPGAWLADFYLLQDHDGKLRRLHDSRSYTLHRQVSPQLRRWAAGQTRGNRVEISATLRRALALDSRHGAAVVLGLLDAAERFDDTLRADVLDLGLDWSCASVRLTALKRLAAGDRRAEALERADGDRAMHIRRWAAMQGRRQPPTTRDDTGAPAGAVSAPAASERAPQAFQPALFG